jgi:hypothetical protein
MIQIQERLYYCDGPTHTRFYRMEWMLYMNHSTVILYRIWWAILWGIVKHWCFNHSTVRLYTAKMSYLTNIALSARLVNVRVWMYTGAVTWPSFPVRNHLLWARHRQLNRISSLCQQSATCVSSIFIRSSIYSSVQEYVMQFSTIQ